ncbi:MAG TPA: hypothetical protein DDW93_00945 [Firmicutes bacterium]|jgi:murein DD-endopeptidase MepM/ murein hydrolase activator NlpD|nr:hypothetical protein [Bacillota bacterium]HBK67833.1 hypothetical protein [Bacillota bacterium]
MERIEQKELKVNDWESKAVAVIEEEQKIGYNEAEIESNFQLLNNERLFPSWEIVILRQILICIMIIIILGIVGKIPRIGSSLIERFHYVLKYGEAENSQQKLYSLAQKQWVKVKEEVSSWFTVEIKEALAPLRAIHFSSPIYYFEQRDFLPQRVRYLLPLNSQVYASAPGTIVQVSPGNGGWKIRIDHGEGWNSIYYPCPRIYVATGEWVKAYQEIGSTSREFFWEVSYDSKLINPRPFLEQDQGLWR